MENQVTVFEKMSREDQMTYQELFSFFDKEGKGEISVKYVPLYMRGLGHCPSENQLQQIEEKFNFEENKTVKYSKLVSFLESRTKEQNVEDQIIEAFEGYQAETGSHSDSSKNSYVSIIGLKKYLCQYGESFTESQAETFIEFLKTNNLKVNDQEFDFKNLAKIMAYSYTQL